MGHQIRLFLSRKLWIVVIILFVLLCGIEVCIDGFVIAVDDRETLESGSTPIERLPETNEEFFFLSELALKDLGWWVNEPFLYSLFLKYDCSHIKKPPNYWNLGFTRIDDFSLLVRYVYDADMTISGGELQIDYDIIIDGWPTLITELNKYTDKLELSELQIDSDEALQIAEQNGGGAIREFIQGSCHVNVHIYDIRRNEEGWNVDYYENGSFEPLLCFNIDPITGEVTQVAERSFRPCRFYKEND
jgi:hypothetical protein